MRGVTFWIQLSFLSLAGGMAGCSQDGFAELRCPTGDGCTTASGGRAGAAEHPAPDDPLLDWSCDRPVVDGAPTPPSSILVVMDRSASMGEILSGGGTRWDRVEVGLGAILDRTQGHADFGLELYPTGVDPSSHSRDCAMPTVAAPVVPIAPGVSSRDAIVAALDATSPAGGTPTARALELALDYFTTGAGASLVGDRYVLLVTDGAPNCNDAIMCGAPECTSNLDGDCPPGVPNCCRNAGSNCLDTTATVAAASALTQAGIGTLVLGMNIVLPEYRDALDAVAIAGGLAQTGATQYLSVDDSTGVNALAAAFGVVAGQLIPGCAR